MAKSPGALVRDLLDEELSCVIFDDATSTDETQEDVG